MKGMADQGYGVGMGNSFYKYSELIDYQRFNILHRQVKSVCKQYTSIAKPLYLFYNQPKTAKSNDG